MALFGLGKKKEEIPQYTPEMHETTAPTTPVDAVIQMRAQGLSNNQIIQNLQRQGYASDQIFDAINQADVKGGVEAMPPGEMEPMQPIENPIPESPGYAEQYPQYPQQHYGYQQNMTEEMIESIVNEKWEKLAKDFKRFDEWKEKTDVTLNKMQQSIVDLNNNFDKLHQAIIGKISEYDQNILNVGTEIKAMEKVFQKVLPTFTQNINELSRVTKNISAAKAKK